MSVTNRFGSSKQVFQAILPFYTQAALGADDISSDDLPPPAPTGQENSCIVAAAVVAVAPAPVASVIGS